MYVFYFFKQKTAYEIRISDWSSDVCSSDRERPGEPKHAAVIRDAFGEPCPEKREELRLARGNAAADENSLRQGGEHPIVAERGQCIGGLRPDGMIGRYVAPGHADRKSTRLNSSH